MKSLSLEVAGPRASANESLKATHVRSESQSRAIALSWKSIPGATGYQVMMSKDSNPYEPAAVFELAAITTKSSAIIKDIPVWQVRSFVVYAFSASAKSTASNIVTNVAGM